MCVKLQPILKKVTPLFFSNLLSKLRSCQACPPPPFENLAGGSTPQKKGGVHTMSSNALYSASLIFRMFINVLTMKKHLMLFFSLLKMKKNFPTSLFCFYSVFCFSILYCILYIIVTILSEKSCQKQGVRKEYKNEDGCIGGLSREGGLKPSAH